MQIDTAPQTTEQPDWEEIATALAQRVNFAIANLKTTGSGVIADMSKPSKQWQHWRDYMADAIEMYPGLTVDRELMHLNELPRIKRAKAHEKIMAERAKKAGGGSVMKTVTAADAEEKSRKKQEEIIQSILGG